MPELYLLNSTDLGVKGKLHAMWAANANLVAVHAANRMFTGRVPTIKETGKDPAPPPMPYTRLEEVGGARGVRTSDTQYPTQPIKFHVWTDTASEGDNIADAIVDCYSNSGFEYNTGKAIDIHYETTNQRQIVKPNYTAWETVVSFTLLLMRNRVK